VYQRTGSILILEYAGDGLLLRTRQHQSRVALAGSGFPLISSGKGLLYSLGNR
jgi:hypothetical protein